MVIKEEVLELLQSTETYRIERTSSTGDMDKFQEAICAFSGISDKKRPKISCNPFIYYSFEQKTFR